MAKTKIKYIDIDNEIYKCKVYKKDKKCKNGCAYIKGNHVYPFRGELKEGKLKAGIYEDSDGNNVLVRAMNKAYKYKLDLVYDPDDDLIKQIIEDEGVVEQDLDVIMGETLDVFSPKISDDDNTLQRLIKIALEKKQIDLKNYEGRFANKGDASNYKSSLLHHGKMSLEKFIKWCKVLDLKFKIIVSDKNDHVPNPMGESIEDEE